MKKLKLLLPISLICITLVGCNEKGENLKNDDINKETNIIDKHDISDEIAQQAYQRSSLY